MLLGSKMVVIVQKFGGTSLGDVPRIQKTAEIIAKSFLAGKKTAVVVSAMAGVTNTLAGWMKEINEQSCFTEEYDVVLSSGEQVTAGLLTNALRSMGFAAKSWLGWQLPILTKKNHGEAEILNIDVQEILRDLDNNIIPVIAGFQGISDGRITTLGRGGSDTTASALAYFLKASYCQIFTDVSGVYTADPFVVKNARRFMRLSYENMLMLASCGAKVLHPSSVKWAMKGKIPVQVLSSFENSFIGTWVGTDVNQKICGITQKNVLQWYVEIDFHDYEPLQERLKKASVVFLDWCFQEDRRFSFLTCCSYKEILEDILRNFSYTSHSCMLITLINQTQDNLAHSKSYLQDIQFLLSSDIPVRRSFSSTHISNFLVEKNDAKKALNQLHDTLELYNVL